MISSFALSVRGWAPRIQFGSHAGYSYSMEAAMWVLESPRTEFGFQCHLFLWLWTSHLIFLTLRFLVRNMGPIKSNL